jgi:hypothetical protein
MLTVSILQRAYKRFFFSVLKADKLNVKTTEPESYNQVYNSVSILMYNGYNTRMLGVPSSIK